MGRASNALLWTSAIALGYLALRHNAGSGTMNESTQNVKYIGTGEFESEVGKAASPAVVDFYATWCEPCRILSPLLDKESGAFTNRIKFFKINVDESASLAQRFLVEGIPNLVFFKDGKVVDRLVGLPLPEELEARLQALADMTNTTPNLPRAKTLNAPTTIFGLP
ncbi:MAG: thioredoxin family protein [Limisphaerales bacterium]